VARFVRSLELNQFLEKTHYVFDWDEGNLTKNEMKHGIYKNETEEVFHNRFIIPLGVQVYPVIFHEARYGVLGTTKAGLGLFICFTLRGNKVRVISARRMSNVERKYYEQEIH